MDGDLLSMKAEWLTRGGPVVVAGLLCVPIAAAATKTRAAAFIAGASLAVILVLIVPYLFTPFAHVMSVSQGRRLLFYLPFAFALTGGALVLARLSWFAVAGALVAWHHPPPLLARRLQVQPQTSRTRLGRLGRRRGPLVAVALGIAGKLNMRYRLHHWALAIVLAFVLPVAVAGIHGMRTHRPEPDIINANLVAAVNKYVTRDEVILSTLKTAYRLTAKAPVYVVAVGNGHGGDTKVNKSYARRIDTEAFFYNQPPDSARRERILERWGVDWVLVRKDLPYPREFMQQYTPVYEDKVFALYPVDPATIARVDSLQVDSAAN